MQTDKMPLIFIGHGSPMNAIENNIFTQSWKNIGISIPKPKAILMFSAHWITEGETRISTNREPDMIYDMYGFPQELYTIKYPAQGDAILANSILAQLKDTFKSENFHEDTQRGLDHGVWSTLIHMFPKADIPIVCISLDYSQSPMWHYNLGKTLQNLRNQGILIMGSGNIVHNLGMIDWSGKGNGYDWARTFDARIADDLLTHNHEDILSSLSWSTARLAHPSYDHLLPLFPLLGASDGIDTVEFLTPEIVMGSLSMRSIVWR